MRLMVLRSADRGARCFVEGCQRLNKHGGKERK